MEAWRAGRTGSARSAAATSDALADLVDVLVRHRRGDLAEPLLEFALERHSDRPRLRLARANVAAGRGRWDAVEQALAGTDPAALPREHACHLHHLAGLARLHAGDPGAALEHFRAGERIEPSWCGMTWNLSVAQALLEPLGANPEADGPAVRHVIRACRLADARLAGGDPAGARDALAIPEATRVFEAQSAARLAEAQLGLEPASPLDVFTKAVALARVAGTDSGLRKPFREEIPGLGWGESRLAAVAQRAREWLEGLGRPEAEETTPQAPTPAPPESAAPAPPPAHPAVGGPQAPEEHALPPVGHESIRALVRGLDAAVRETARYVRGLPGWDETQTLGEDLSDLAPVRSFLAGHRAALVAAGRRSEDAAAEVERVSRHLDYCVNFELHRRKLFFTDASLAWMLARTRLDIEGRALRLPFPCFGLVFTDRATLELAEALLGVEGDAAARVQVLTIYVKRLPALDGRHGSSLSMVLDARDGRWPDLLRRELRFDEDDDLDRILGGGLPGGEGGADAPRSAEMRRLAHVAVNAILYATSADVAWPLSESPVRRLRARGRGLGKAKQARIAHRAQELRRRYSDEDVFYLPGKIPISQLRALQRAERGPRGSELMARFMVRGHWRRAARGWRDRRLRWIEPYWKGPELAAIVEKEYKLEI